MPICQNCKQKWTWKQTMKTIFKLNCPYCGEKQYETTSSRKKTSIFVIFPIFVLSFNVIFQLSWWFLVLIIVLLVTINWMTYPFLLKLSNEKEVIW